MDALETSPDGLGDARSSAAPSVYGPNEVGQEKQHGWAYRLFHAVRNPLVVLLTALAVISFATGDVGGGTVMLLMVMLGVSLRLVQETRADNAAAKLRAMIRVTATVVRGGKPVEVPLRDLVPGRRHQARRRRHDPRRRAARLGQGPVRHPGQPDRRIAAGREGRRPGDATRHLARWS